MTPDERRRRIQDHNFMERVTGELGWFYISFADAETFLGGCYVKAHGFGTACEMAHRLHINPGGEAFGGRIDIDKPYVPPEYRCRLLSLADLEALFPGQVMTSKEFLAKHGPTDFPGADVIDQDKP